MILEEFTYFCASFKTVTMTIPSNSASLYYVTYSERMQKVMLRQSTKLLIIMVIVVLDDAK